MVTAVDSFSAQADDEDEKQKAAQGAAAPVINSGVGGATISANAASAPSANTTATSSGRYTNLSKYLDANKNGGGLANKIATNVNTAGAAVQANTQAATNTFGQQASGEAAKWRGVFEAPQPAPVAGQPAAPAQPAPVQPAPAQPAAPQPVGQAPAPQPGSLLSQVAVDPTKITSDADAMQKFISARDAAYKGPSSLLDLQGDQNLANLQTRAQDVQNMVTQTQSESGRFNLLRQMFGKPTYSKGQQSLDNLLIQSNPNDLNALQRTKKEAATTNRAINTAEMQALRQVGGLKQEAQDVRNQVQGTLQKAVTDKDQAVVGQIEGAKNMQQHEIDAFMKRFNSGQLLPGEMEKLGIKPGENLYGVTMGPDGVVRKTADAGTIIDGLLKTSIVSNPLQLTKAEIDKYSLASSDDYAKMAALSQLMGTTGSPEAQALLESYRNNAAKAGTFDARSSFDIGNAGVVRDTINAAKSDYERVAADLRLNVQDSQARLNYWANSENVPQVTIDQEKIYLKAAQDKLNMLNQVFQIDQTAQVADPNKVSIVNPNKGYNY